MFNSHTYLSVLFTVKIVRHGQNHMVIKLCHYKMDAEEEDPADAIAGHFWAIAFFKRYNCWQWIRTGSRITCHKIDNSQMRHITKCANW